jgi:anti-sigma B factor antagonist
MKQEHHIEHETLIVEHDDNGRTVLSGLSVLDVYVAPYVREFIHRAVDDPETSEITYDATGLEHIDSVGLALWIGALKKSRAREKDFVVSNPEPAVLSALEITGLVQVLMPQSSEQ